MGVMTWVRNAWERRSLLRNAEAYRDFYGLDSRQIAGVSVNSRSMLGHAPLWRGINLIASSVSKLPLETYRRTPDEDRERDALHAVYPLLRRKVNPQLRASAWLRLMTFHAVLYGNGYSAILRDANWKPRELIPLAPWSTWPETNTPDGNLWYVATMPNGQQRRLTPDDVFHVRGLSSDGITGYSVIELLAPSTGTDLAAAEYAARWFAGGCTIQNVLQIPGHLKGPARDQAIKDWDRISAGLGRTGKSGILYDGVTVSQLGFDAEKSQLLQAREFGLIVCADVLNLPPHKLGHPARTSYSSLEQENAAFLSESLEPWLQEFETEAYLKLLSPSEQETESHFCEFNRAALLQSDLAARYAAYAIGKTHGWLSTNDIRRKENLPGIGPAGDVYREQLNTAPAGEPANTEQGDDDDPGTDDRLPQRNGNPSGATAGA